MIYYRHNDHTNMQVEAVVNIQVRNVSNDVILHVKVDICYICYIVTINLPLALCIYNSTGVLCFVTCIVALKIDIICAAELKVNAFECFNVSSMPGRVLKIF